MDIVSHDNIDSSAAYITETLQLAIKTAVPVVKVKSFTLLKPALPEHILTLIRLRDVKYLLYKKNRTAYY